MSQSIIDSRLDSIISGLSSSAWTDQERSKYCASVGEHPLFATGSVDLDSSKEAVANHAAIRNTEYDELDSPLALANEAKERGNAAFAAGGAFKSHAMRHYGDALRHARVLAASDADAARAIFAVVHANVAAVHLAHGFFISALDSSSESLRNGGGVKAAWRATKACLALGRATSAVEFCELGRTLLPSSSSSPGTSKSDGAALVDVFSPLIAEAQGILKAQQANEMTSAKTRRQRESSLARVRAACIDRRIKTGPPLFSGLHRTAAEPYIDDADEMHWPLAILYPEVGQSDWFDDVGEATCVGSLIDDILAEPPEWANKGSGYAPSAVDIFFKARPCKGTPIERAWSPESHADTPEDDPRGSEWVLVPRDAPLLLIIAQPSYIVADLPILYVVPRNSAFWKGMLRDAGGAFPVLSVPDFNAANAA